MSAKFTFYEVVDVMAGRAAIASVVGCRGVVLGMAQCDDGRWVYAVNLLESGDGWDFEESELATAGMVMKREDFYDGSSVSVLVDSKTGEGRIKGSEERESE